ncbi:hypothetical protein BOTBODRAFT_42588 [Botryobasidium botryosum FD-172 SS1]|uniref:F-box domain-containing protein n=1 Tax=Botryobasidium botryosum (strain FD-172 SS1) TaxID=930990 RepID=A0A067MTZ8_BOTB1|nr:hypothetical protein BOTBODRAFT_42588 [Botryobasidium botryosum FD-172 SS1]
MVSTRSKNPVIDAGETVKRESFWDVPFQRKKRRLNNGKAVEAGKLAHLITDMPFDILLEIMAHLLPDDLISLTYTGRAFRNILRRRSSAEMWRFAFANAGMPECPDDLTELQYANLAFGTHCHQCGKSPVKKIEWALRTKLCGDCRGSLLTPHINIRGDPRTFYDIFPRSDTLMHSSRWGSGHRGFYQPEVRRAVKHLKRLEGTPKEHEKFKAKRRARTAIIEKHAAACRTWHHRWLATAEIELQKEATVLRDERRALIKAKLIELGWERELSDYPQWEDHSLVNQAKALTERGWDNVRVALERYLQVQRHKRVKREMEARHEQRRQVLYSLYLSFLEGQEPSSLPWPNPAEVAHFAAFKAVAEDDTVAPELDVFEDVMSLLPEAIVLWRSSLETSFTALLPEPDRTKDHLQLATTIFSSSGPQDVNFYPTVLLHRHITGKRIMKPSSTSEMPEVEESFQWKVPKKSFKFNEQASNIAKNVIMACGMDPATTTPADLDELDARFVCMMCTKFSKSLLAMTWRKSLHHKSACMVWRVATDEEDEKIRELESKQAKTLKSVKTWSCNHCRPQSHYHYLFDKTKAVEHVKNLHRVKKPKEELDYICDPNGKGVDPAEVKFEMESALILKQEEAPTG